MKTREVDVTPYDCLAHGHSQGLEPKSETHNVTIYPAALLGELVWSEAVSKLRTDDKISRCLRVSEAFRNDVKKRTGKKKCQYVVLTEDEWQFLEDVCKLVSGWNETQLETRKRVADAKEIDAG